MRAPASKRHAAPAALSARLAAHVTLEAQPGRKDRRLLRWSFGRLGGAQRGRGGPRAGAARGLPAPRLRLPPPQRRQGGRSTGPAIGQTRSPGVPPRALARRRGASRDRTAGSRLLAANAAARQFRCSRAVALCLHAPARQRHGAEIAARRRVVQDLRCKDCNRDRRARHAADDQAAASAGRVSRPRAARTPDRLPNSVQGRSRSRQRPAARRGKRQPRPLGFSRSPVPRAQHRRAARQSARWRLSICRRHGAAAGGAAALAGKGHRSRRVRPARPIAADSPAARLLRERHSTRNFDERRADHACGACALSRRHCPRPLDLRERSKFGDESPSSRTRSGRIRGRAAATSSSSISPSTSAKASHAASIITTPAPTPWRR